MSLDQSKLPIRTTIKYEAPTAPPEQTLDHILTEKLRRTSDFAIGEDAATPKQPTPIAVIVFHGMGEQVRFQTLGDLAKSLLRFADAPIQTAVSLSRPADSFVTRAEISWHDQQTDHDLEVHLYEAYWAPITEGQVTYFETLKFLFRAAVTGIRHSRLGKTCTFERWMFRDTVRLPIGPTTQASLILVMLALLLIVTSIALVSLKLARLVKDFSTGSLNWALIGHLLLVSNSHSLPVDILLSVLFWLAVAFSFLARYFIVEYVGDVAAYISPFKASKFQTVRDNIQKVGNDIAGLVLGFTAAPVPNYQKVLFVGHSLGSVLAYDTLNATINRDLTTGQHRHVIDRIHALITFGSPLDKTAFLFRNQANTLSDPLREQMVAASQPLILDYDFRNPRFKWTNIYSPRDVISGVVDYYDDPAQPAYAAKRVVNVVDPDANIPFVAHVQYWDNPLLSKILLDAIR